MLSVLNVAGVYSFNSEIQAWILHLEGNQQFVFYAKGTLFYSTVFYSILQYFSA